MTRFQRRSSGNEGIQANNVKADVLAVGRGARASKTVLRGGDDQKLAAAIADLRSAIDALDLAAPAKRSIAADINRLEKPAETSQPGPDVRGKTLERIISKLKTAGVVVGQTAAVIEPIKTIAAALKLAALAL
jgi:hypothetical protein